MMDLAQIEQMVRSGDIESARKSLERITAGPIKDSTAVANLCWRAGLPQLGLRILLRKMRLTLDARPNEAAEYAACLIKVGAHEEGLERLARIRAADYPKRSLYEAFGWVAQWDYERAIPLLKAYANSTTDPYQAAIAQVNLSGAYIFERAFDDAARTLDWLSCATSGLLLGNTLELQAAFHVYSGNYREAEAFLKHAEKQLERTKTLDRFFVEKWRTLSRFCISKDEQPVEEFKKRAHARRHWETVRDCDRFRAVVLKNTPLFTRLFFGTPFASFRKRLSQDFGERVLLPTHYEWSFGAKGRTYRVLEGELINGRQLKIGQVPYRFLALLCSDFYRPQRIAVLFRHLFPGEYFNVNTSPHRVHEATRRLRNFFSSAKLPFSVKEEQESYLLTVQAPAAIWVPKMGLDSLDLKLSKLHEVFGTRPFSVMESVKVLNISASSALRVLGAAIRSGRVISTGRSRNFRY